MKRAVYAAFGKRLGLAAQQARHLITLSNEAHNRQVRWHNENNPTAETKADAAVKAVEEYAKRFNVQTVWPGLYPVFRKDGQDIYLPD